MLFAVSSLAAASTGSSLTGIVLAAVVSADCPVPTPGVTGGGDVSRGPIGVGADGILPVVPGPGGTLCGLDVGGPTGAGVNVILTGVGAAVVMRFRFLDIFITLGYKICSS
jgi:hypothetical protein